MTTDQTATEVYESANGFDEVAVRKAFSEPLSTLASEDKMTFARALAFLVFKRGGQNDMEAKSAALGLSNKALTEFFAPETEDESEETLARAKVEARAMAEFCIRTSHSKETFLSLTTLERAAFLEVHNEDATGVN